MVYPRVSFFAYCMLLAAACVAVCYCSLLLSFAVHMVLFGVLLCCVSVMWCDVM